MTSRQTPPNIFLPTDCPMKIKVSPAQSNGFVFNEAPTYTDLHNPDISRVK